MANYKLANQAKQDILKIYANGVETFGEKVAEKYFHELYNHFESISKNPFAFESVDHIKTGYRRCPCKSNSIYYRINQNVVEIMIIIGSQEMK